MGERWVCPACRAAVAVCSECLHEHEWFDHVGPGEHMCRWCLTSEYDADPSGRYFVQLRE